MSIFQNFQGEDVWEGIDPESSGNLIYTIEGVDLEAMCPQLYDGQYYIFENETEEPHYEVCQPVTSEESPDLNPSNIARADQETPATAMGCQDYIRTLQSYMANDQLDDEVKIPHTFFIIFLY